VKTELVQSVTGNFEACTQRFDSDVEFWLARDIQCLLGYSEWRNFVAVINKGKTACEVSGHTVADHFVDVNKVVHMESGSLMRWTIDLPGVDVAHVDIASWL
jgi:DNA-damage-inducible protein D